MRTHFLGLLFILSFLRANATGYLPPAGAEALGNGGIGLFGQNAFSAANHPAMMPWQKKAGLGFSFTNRYAVKDINQVYLTAVVPYKTFGYGLKLYNFGNSTYREQCIGLSVAHSFHPNFSIGLGATYQSVSIVRYGHNAAINAEVSMVAKVNEHLSLAFRLNNPERAKFSDYQDERLATTGQFGLSYKVSKQVVTQVEIEKSNAFKPNIKAGINYMPKENINLRFGFSSLQPQFTFGFGFKHKKCNISWASIIHQALGVSSNLSLTFELGK